MAPPEATSTISPLVALLLGVVEGLTEFLPISSTGHLILSAELMDLDLGDPGIGAFLIVIQAGALGAVIGIYRRTLGHMLRGLMGSAPDGLRLLGRLTLAFLPAAVAALLFQEAIKGRLFAPAPVGAALGAGGVAMILIERYRKRKIALSPSPNEKEINLSNLSWRMALIIGLAQCLALWPGMSRSMVTIVAGILIGLSPRSAAEFSFLLALPTLGAATLYDLWTHGGDILNATGWLGLGLGFTFSCLVAALAIKGLLRYLARHGLSVFGWYRIAVAVVLFGILFGSGAG